MKLILVLVIAFASSNYVFGNGWDNDYVNLIKQQASRINEKTLVSQLEEGLPSSRASAFNCNVGTRSNPTPTSVHKLKPNDIDVIGAIGDSLTAANGAKASTILGLLEECRGVAWNMGGENNDISKSMTLPNILRQFNPKLYGFSVGSGKSTSEDKAVFNLADPGDTSHEMYGQVVNLVKRLKASPSIDFQNSWKLITFFIGGTALCKSCKDLNYYSPGKYVDNIKNVLDYMKANLPRTFVNLVLTLDVTGIQDLSGITCRNMQKTFCNCALDDTFVPTLKGITKSYQQGTEDLIASGRYDDKDDFTVVLQPFMKEMRPPTKPTGGADYSFFAPDCFHFSVKGHQAAAVELFNSMMTPVGQKPVKWSNLDQDVKCPTQTFPYLFTSKNSRMGLRQVIGY